MRIQTLGLVALFATASMAAHAVDIQSWQLKNGAKVLFIESHQNPIVDVSVSFNAGGMQDDPAKLGVAGFTGGLMDAGAGDLDEEAFNERTADLAVSISSAAGTESAGVGFRSLSKKDVLNPTVALTNLVLTKPRFDAAILKREQDRAVLSLRQGETSPGFLSARAYATLNYGDHPYGYGAKTTEASIRAISRDDLVRFHQAYYAQDNAIVSIVGDLSKTQANTLAERLLQGLPAKASELRTLPKVDTDKKGQRRNIAHPSSQASIVMGYPVITRDDPDYYAFMVGNYILGGGGFESRLMKELRDNRGLTYGVSSSFSPSLEKGTFSIGLKTKKATTEEALALSQKVLTDYLKQGPSATEVKQAQDNMIGGFPLRIDTNAKLLSYLSLIGQYNLPLTYLDDYPKAVAKVTPEQIKEVWQRRINPAFLNIVVVGG